MIDEVTSRKRLTVRESNGQATKLPTFYDKENVTGKVLINLNKTKKLKHNGIKIELVGQIEHKTDKKNVLRFITLSRDLEPPGTLTNEVTSFTFSFTNVEKQYETYRGSMNVKYFLKVTLTGEVKTTTQEQEFAVINPITDDNLEDNNTPIKLEVGIEEWLHLIFEVNKSKFKLNDCIKGQVVFKKVSIRLKSMELQIIKRETTGAGNI
jgi:vacuolar protein sorting-associated protein 26